MKRYTFRLEQVLRVRRIQEDQAKGAMVVAQRTAREASAAAEARLSELRDQRPPAGAVGHAAFLAARTLHELRADAVVQAREAEARAGEVVELRRVELGLATQRVKGLERLDERRREDHVIDLGREVDREADDVTTSRTLLQRRGR